MKTLMTTVSCICATVLILSGCGRDTDSQSSMANQPASSTSVAAPPALTSDVTPGPVTPSPPPPSHNYAMVDNGTYGYEPALSENDVRNGTATKPLIMVRYVGKRNGAYVIIILGQDANDTRVTNRVSCQAPCEFAKSEAMSGDIVVTTETIHVKMGSLVGAMLEDAISGQLSPYGQSSSNQIMSSSPIPSNASDAAITVPQPAQGDDAPLQQTSFDCGKARSIPEYLICHDPDLAAADRDLSTVYQQARDAVTDKAAFGDRIRKQWNFREKNCRDKECLMSWYGYQKRVLKKIAQTGDVTAQDN